MKLRSLKWRLLWRLVVLQAATFFLLGALFVLILWSSGFVGISAPDEDSMDALGSSVTWNEQGAMQIENTEALREERRKGGSFWFLVRDADGQTVSEGRVPPQFLAMAASGGNITEARFSGDKHDPQAMSARLRTVSSSHGPLQIFMGRQGALPSAELFLTLSAFASGAVVPGILLTALVALAVTPLVARSVHRSLSDVATAAKGIDVDHRGYRLPLDDVPSEIAPLVVAMNDTLARLDEGYDRQKRFMLAAAHELRTPIAILQTRLQTMPSSDEVNRLLEDVARLATLAEQLLDLQRLNQDTAERQPIDLAALARRQAIDLAPLIVAAGYGASFEVHSQPETILGDAPSIERALANLVQNALQHGGRRGTITIAVRHPAQISVLDEGPGIDASDEDRIFEPFQRITARSVGIGLGLHLVREIVNYHGGRIWIESVPAGGASFNMSFPLAVSAEA